MPLPAALAKKLQKRGIITPKPEVTKHSNFKGYESCPNKYNIYHQCMKYCMIRWKVGILEPTPKYVKQRERLLKKYPLPANWREIYDRGWFYYWDVKNDMVSWLPPKHPRSKISRSAAYLRGERSLLVEGQQTRLDETKKHSAEEKDSKKHSRYKSSKSRDTDLHLDPMDPAAYSDIPKGTWSSGLDSLKPEPRIKLPTGPVYQIKHYHPSSNHKKN